MPFILAQTPSLGNHFLAELRNVDVQQDRMRFRKNLQRLGEIFAYEISKTFSYRDSEIDTPLGTAETLLMNEQPVLATILRAGLPLHEGMLNFFDQADSAFIGAFRKTHKTGKFTIELKYFKELLAHYKIKELHIVSVIASKEGLAHVQAHLPQAKLWIGDVDEELTSKSYIVPGLGDAGDLAFGEKV